MSIELIAIVMFASMIVLLLTGRHIFAIVGAVATISALALWGVGGERMPYMGGVMFLKWYPLLALPPFIFMGLTLSKSGVADKLYHALYLWMGRIRGGLAIGTVGLCALIAAMSGGNVAGTVTAGTIALPAMVKRKYDKLMLTGTVQAGGTLGVLIPPSLVFILYGIIARVSIGHLWIAGILPGILLVTMFIIYIAVRCRMQPHLGPAIPPEEQVGWGDKFRALGAGIAPVILVFVVLGLLFMGVTTIIECSAIGAVGALVAAAINRRLTRKMFLETLEDTLGISAMFLWIVVAAFLFSAVFDGLGAIHGVAGIFDYVGGGVWGTLIMMQASFLLMGMILDDTAMLLIVAPLYIPIVSNLGFSLVWYGVLYTLTVQAAFLTPPFGYSLFIMKGIVPVAAPGAGIGMGDIYRSAIPFVGIIIACLAIVMAFPQIALFLPGIVFGG